MVGQVGLFRVFTGRVPKFFCGFPFLKHLVSALFTPLFDIAKSCSKWRVVDRVIKMERKSKPIFKVFARQTNKEFPAQWV